MSENLHDIDQYFKSGLEGHEEVPNRSVWETLDNQLNKVETVHLRHKYAQLKYWSIAITVVLTSALLYVYNEKQQQKNNPLEEVIENSPSTLKSKQPTITEKKPTNSSQSSSSSSKDEEKSAIEPTIDNASQNKTPDWNSWSNNKKNLSDRSNSTLYKNTEKLRSNRFKNILSEVQKKNTFQNVNQIVSKVNEPVVRFDNQNKLYYHSFPKNTSLKEKGFRPEPGYKGLLNDTEKTLAIKNPITRKNLFAAGIYYSADKPFQRLKEGRREHDEDDKYAIMNGETIQLSINYGALGSFSVGNKLSIQTGISFSKRISNIAEKQVYARRPDFRNSGDLKFKFNCAAGYSYIDPKTTSNLRAGDSIKVTGSINELRYVELPMLINYQLGNGRLHLNLLSGISANFIQKGTLQTNLVNSWGTKIPVNTELQGLKKTYFSALMGAGVEYDLFPSLSIYAQEVIKGSLGSINQNAPTKTYANSTGLQLGIRVKW